jgi:hypothetical protein
VADFGFVVWVSSVVFIWFFFFPIERRHDPDLAILEEPLLTLNSDLEKNAEASFGTPNFQNPAGLNFSGDERRNGEEQRRAGGVIFRVFQHFYFYFFT